MELIKAITDTFKITIYEVLAILLPGAMLVEVTTHMEGGASASRPDTLLYLALAYLAGVIAQGICAFLVDCGKALRVCENSVGVIQSRA